MVAGENLLDADDDEEDDDTYGEESEEEITMIGTPWYMADD